MEVAEKVSQLCGATDGVRVEQEVWGEVQPEPLTEILDEACNLTHSTYMCAWISLSLQKGQASREFVNRSRYTPVLMAP